MILWLFTKTRRILRKLGRKLKLKFLFESSKFCKQKDGGSLEVDMKVGPIGRMFKHLIKKVLVLKLIYQMSLRHKIRPSKVEVNLWIHIFRLFYLIFVN